MALAILQPGRSGSNEYEFTADLGTNDFYQYKLANEKVVEEGAERLEEVVYTSPLLRRRAAAGPFVTAFEFQVPAEHVSGRRRSYIQLYSFRDAQRNGPAISRILRVSSSMEVFARAASHGRSGMSHAVLQAPDAAFAPSRKAKFSFQESGAGTLSGQMWLEQLLQVAQLLAPILANATAGALAGAAGGATTATPAGGQQILGVLNGLIGMARTGANSAPPGSGTVAAGAPASGGPPAMQGPVSGPLSHSVAMDGGIISGPALLALVSALAPAVMAAVGPVLQQLPRVATEGLQAILQSNIQRQAINQQNNQNFVAALLAEMNRNGLLREALLRGGTAPTPGTQPPGAPAPGPSESSAGAGAVTASPAVAAAAAQSLARALKLPRALSGSPKFTRQSAAIHLEFDTSHALSVGGLPRVMYSAGKDISLSLTIRCQGRTPARPLPKAIIEVEFIQPQNLTPLAKKIFKVRDVQCDEPLALEFQAQELDGLPSQTELLVSASMRWPIHGGETMGATGNQLISFTEGYLFNSVEGADSAPVPLKDFKKYRSFWNKVWESPSLPASGTHSRWELDALCRFYFRATPEAANARLETRFLTDSAETSEITLAARGRMKSGMECSLDELNKILPLVGEYQPLAPEQLEALKSPMARRQFELEGTAELRLNGNKRALGVVWVYPEVTVQKLGLSRAGEIDAKGQVTSLIQESVRFPIPSAVHFITLKST